MKPKISTKDQFLKIRGMVVIISISDIEFIKNTFQNALDFEVIYQNQGVEYVLYNPNLGNHFFLRLLKDNANNEEISKEHLIVFYLNNQEQYINLCKKLNDSGLKQEVASNPFWNQNGTCFVIGDDVRIIICPGSYQHYKARIALPAIDLNYIENYLKSMGLYKIGHFQNHNKYDGIMLSSQLLIDCHMEFTHFQDDVDLKPIRKFSIALIFDNLSDNELRNIQLEAHTLYFYGCNNSQSWVKACKEILLK